MQRINLKCTLPAAGKQKGTAGRRCLFREAESPRRPRLAADLVLGEDVHREDRNGEKKEKPGKKHGRVALGVTRTCR
jgi:hypothetical protein